MIIRLRSKDGLERVEVADNATLSALRAAIEAKLGVPLAQQRLSRDPGLLTAKDLGAVAMVRGDSSSLKSLGVNHGDLLYLLYDMERQVEPAYKRSAFEARAFGAHITMDDVMAKQTRIERQEKSRFDIVSFDRHAANQFQSYVQSALAFSIKRGGLLYGSVDGDTVKVEFVYEPPQEGSATDLRLQRHTDEERQVDFLAELLGLKKVGWIFSQSTAERDFIMSTQELVQVAQMQDELGELCATIVVSWDASEEGGQVHFEAFQCSEQCVRMVKEGWFVPPEPSQLSGVSKMRSPRDPSLAQPVIVASKDVDEVDNDYFLCPAKIADHEGPLHTEFPIENRLLPQGKAELRDHLKRGGSQRSYVEKLSDLHLMLWLSKQPNLDANDMLLLCDAVKDRKPVLEGYRVIIDSIAGLTQ